MPSVTVAITTYNLSNYLPLCFAELEKQTFQDFSVLVYDDCSTDGTRQELARQKQRWGDRLEIILGSIPQKLPAKSRNVLLNSGKIRGKYCVFLDGDDSIEPDFLYRLYTLAEETGAQVAACAYDRVDAETGRVLCEEMKGFPKTISMGQEDAPSLAAINTALWNRLIRTETIGQLRMPEFSVGEDAAFLLMVYQKCTLLAFTEQIGIHYRVRSSSVISNTPEESIYAFARELHRMYLQSQDPWMKDNIAFAAFIHIGLSMTMRAYDNPNIETSKIIAWIQKDLAEHYSWLRGTRYLRPQCLLRMGIKGFGILGAYCCYRLHIYSFFLWVYKIFVSLFHMDIKF